MPVLYIPRHAQGMRPHPDCQGGIVTGKTATHVINATDHLIDFKLRANGLPNPELS